MFLLFFNLYLAMFQGRWIDYTWNDMFGSGALNVEIRSALNSLGTFLTNIFNDTGNYQTLGDDLFSGVLNIVALVLALITSIGIVVIAVKGIKHIFTIFFEGLR